MIIGNRQITASRWPWQRRTSVGAMDLGANKIGDKYGWRGSEGLGRFGGGWNWEFGIQIGGSSMIANLIWGSVSISKLSRCKGCDEFLRKGQKRGKHPLWDYHLECVPVKLPDPPPRTHKSPADRDDKCPF